MRARGFAVQILALLLTWQGLAQSPSWRDGTLENLPPPVMGGNWREQRLQQQQRDRAQVESMQEFRRAESTWVWTEHNAGDANQPLILFRGTPSARTPNR